MTEDELVGWHDRLNEHEFEQAPGVGSAGKEFTCNVGDLGSIPELGRSPGEGKGYPLQYSGLENSIGLQRVGPDWVTFTLTFWLV